MWAAAPQNEDAESEAPCPDGLSSAEQEERGQSKMSSKSQEATSEGAVPDAAGCGTPKEFDVVRDIDGTPPDVADGRDGC
jgi:hypothetical protein